MSADAVPSGPRRGHVLTPEGDALAERAEAHRGRSRWGMCDNRRRRTLRSYGKVRSGRARKGLAQPFIAPATGRNSSMEWPGSEIDLISLSDLVAYRSGELTCRCC